VLLATFGKNVSLRVRIPKSAGGASDLESLKSGKDIKDKPWCALN